ncbi:MAG TPA: NADPH-dependent 7-cyano-7-deazaguanine reductase QueF [Rickettsia endosymbiont of Sericostoma sp.]|uniref:NADPH-dependent 7-cyano-7-deazaguanine reductase QueF n=1 Tax=unclassified Candidatus Tisiphia TaxID=2996318 RepID=UPI001D55E5A7|nr:NADPH-dependent 7-cyano-7-deazaguanine reductase QueF [Rickettsia endosymbiont of Sericostoma sp. HW-2014]HJD63914.1 NADPH-dependent 7-cyano-7-deazaguanine reductase QueF [Rickettsia endosymbiont of Sericostoma sp.]
MDLETILGKQTAYIDVYDNSLLQPISRKFAREQLQIIGDLPFYGFDIWNCYEVSWLNQTGKPEIRILEFMVSSDSPNIIESKSLKLYLNSFSNTKLSSSEQVIELITRDLSLIFGSDVIVFLKDLESYDGTRLQSFSGINLDRLDVTITSFEISQNLPKLLEDNTKIVDEVLYSNLLKSNCLVTNQPDWASVQISYRGKKIDHSSLLKYLVSFRNHNEFHEQCVERIFCDISKFCIPDELTVYARYTRRGGIDINPIRSSSNLDITKISNLRHIRQ